MSQGGAVNIVAESLGLMPSGRRQTIERNARRDGGIGTAIDRDRALKARRHRQVTLGELRGLV